MAFEDRVWWSVEVSIPVWYNHEHRHQLSKLLNNHGNCVKSNYMGNQQNLSIFSSILNVGLSHESQKRGFKNAPKSYHAGI